MPFFSFLPFLPFILPHVASLPAPSADNIVNFDLPYLLNRAQALKISSFPYLGRLKGIPTRMKDKMFQSKQVRE